MDPYNYESYTACTSELEFGEFKSQAPVGEKAPEFTLIDLEGRGATRSCSRSGEMATPTAKGSWGATESSLGM